MKKKSTSLADRLFPIQEAEGETPVINISPEQRRLITETFDFSIATIQEYLKVGSIFIPTYQRRYVWNRAQASRLIESLIIQCPIPVIYLNQERDEKLSVIDGNQRLTSIKLFLEDDFELRGLTAYPELEGSTFSSLDPRFRRHILNRTLRCITILKETHPQIKFDVFERINTGAVQLNPQEVRHGVYHGPLMSLVEELASEKIWKSLSGLKSDNRMKGAELVLRFLALYANEKDYSKPLSGFINRFCETHRFVDDATRLEWKALFLRTLEQMNILFGAAAFRLIGDNLKPTVTNLNAALFDCQMVTMARMNPARDCLKGLDKRMFLRAFHALLAEPRFQEAIESGTSATASVNYRLSRFRDFMKEHVGGA